MSNAILQLVQQQLDSDSIQQMSRSIGADPASTSKAISMALPAILGETVALRQTGRGGLAVRRAR